MKEDRNLIRQLIKDSNEEVLSLLRKHKKKLDLSALQIDIRKIVTKSKGKTPIQSPPTGQSPNPTPIIQNPSNKQISQSLDKKQQGGGSKTNLKTPIESKQQLSESHASETSVPNPIKSDQKINNVQFNQNITNNSLNNNNSSNNLVNNQKKNDKNQNQNDLKNSPIKNKEHNNKNIDNTSKSPVKNSEEIKKKDESISKDIIKEKISPKSSEGKRMQPDSNKKREKSIEKPQIQKKIEKQHESIKQPNEEILKYDTPSFKNTQPNIKKDFDNSKKLKNSIELNPKDKSYEIYMKNKSNYDEQIDSFKNDIKKDSPFDNMNIKQSDFSYPNELSREFNDSINSVKKEKEESIKKSKLENVQSDSKQKENSPQKLKLSNAFFSPTKSERSTHHQNSLGLKSSILKTIKIITEKPNFNTKVILDIQKHLGISEMPAEIVIDKVLRDVHLTRISKTYFKYKIEMILGKQLDPIIFEKLFEICDIKKDGFIDINELGYTLQTLCNGVLKSNDTKKLFLLFDKKNQGFFRENDFVNVLEKINFDDQVDETILKNIFAHLDEDQKGLVSYWDFYLIDLIRELKEITGIEIRN